MVTDAGVRSVLRLLRNAKFSLGKQTDSVKLIRKAGRNDETFKEFFFVSSRLGGSIFY